MIGSTDASSSKTHRPKRRLRRGVSILPSLFTTGNLFLGFWAIVRSLDGRFTDAAQLIGWAMVLDMLDGRVARLTGTTSEFGAQLDSLADMISFGVAPALLAYLWAFQSVQRSGWLVAFLFVVCGALRLARFNVQSSTSDGRFFVGLPIPAAAAQIATVAHFVERPVMDILPALLVLSLVVVLSFLMVSTLRYRSFKRIDLGKPRSYINVLGIALLFLLVAIQPETTLLAASALYTASGPTLQFASWLRRRGGPPAAPVVLPSA